MTVPPCSPTPELEIISKCAPIVFRLARERMAAKIGWDEAVSTGYLALLLFSRAGLAWNDERHMMRSAAQAVRRAVIDEHRRQFGKHGQRVGRMALECDMDADSELETVDRPVNDPEPSDTLDRVASLLTRDVDRVILRMRVEGYSLGEIGDRVGLTESRICQRWRENVEPVAKRVLAEIGMMPDLDRERSRCVVFRGRRRAG